MTVRRSSEPAIYAAAGASSFRQDVRALLGLMTPLLTGSVLSSLTILANTVIVGRSEPNGLLLSGLFLPFSLLVVAVIESLRAPLTVYVTQAAQAPDLRMMVGGFAALGAILMLLVAVAVVAVGDRFFMRLDAPRDTLRHAARFVTCMQISSAALTAGVLANAAVFARGFARRALAISIAANLVNLVVTSGSALLLRQGAIGGAWGTGAAGILMLMASFSNLPRACGARQYWRSTTKRVFLMTRNIAIPVFGSYLVLSVYAAAINDVLMSIGPHAVAGFGVANRLQNLFMMPAVALGTALAIRAGSMHRLGASASDVSVARFAGRGLAVGIAMYALVSAIAVVTQPLITPLMAGQGAAAEVLRAYLLIVCPSFVFFGPMLSLLIYLDQTGQGRLALFFNVVSLCVTLTAAYAAAANDQLIRDVFIAIATCNVITALVLFAIVRQPAVHRPPRMLAHGGTL
ncbi:MATE family efflux transporter [Ralstonia pseudosolanacearum]|uniref:MATE family efflux transporter n=1 Tax=Ralstonia solanacearum TaxID=305 RepID=A0A0S4TY20_RALSL|nr:hypothetical protein RSP799_23255 [Ralstonia solanacearum]CUV14876.1 membrane protein of unknown function [Ralstonia solanacearum]